MVIVSGRVHPGESNGSIMMHGFIQYLIGDDPDVIEFRK